MAYSVVWLPAAVDDLDAIASYIAMDSPSYAAGFVHRVTDAARGLAEFPRRGRVVPEWVDENVRELILDRYRLIYHVRRNNVIVLAVIHGARLLPGELRARFENV